jgi:hypothetical protein
LETTSAEAASSCETFGAPKHDPNTSAMRDFMSACDHCLSGYSDDGHSLDDEGYDPSCECFHIDQGDHDEDNHLGMPGNDDALCLRLALRSRGS